MLKLKNSTKVVTVVAHRRSSSVTAAEAEEAAASSSSPPSAAVALANAALGATGVAATAAAAALGASAARGAGMSVPGAIVVGGVCGVGGGTVRDALLGKKAFWLEQPAWLWLSAAAGAAALAPCCVTWRPPPRYVSALFTLSLGGSALAGATVADAHASSDPLAAAFFALLSAAGGGVLRDALLQRRPGAFYADGVATAVPAAVGAGAALLATGGGAGRVLAACAAALGTHTLLTSQHPVAAKARAKASAAWASLAKK